MAILQICKDKESPCFARKNGRCVILSECPERCTFKKPERFVTNGVRYPEKHPDMR